MRGIAHLKDSKLSTMPRSGNARAFPIVRYMLLTPWAALIRGAVDLKFDEPRNPSVSVEWALVVLRWVEENRSWRGNWPPRILADELVAVRHVFFFADLGSHSSFTTGL
jgi:hypothetical protein